jgi:acetone carboxylase gamma subunit
MKEICWDCDNPSGRWMQDHSPKGTILKCRCGKKFIMGSTVLQTIRIVHFIMKKVPIAGGKRPREIWQHDPDRHMVYFTCPRCGRIHQARDTAVDPDGFIGGNRAGTCIDCDCGLHFWPYLEGWKAPRPKPRSTRGELLHQKGT